MTEAERRTFLAEFRQAVRDNDHLSPAWKERFQALRPAMPSSEWCRLLAETTAILICERVNGEGTSA
jgi:hypothetical protein